MTMRTGLLKSQDHSDSLMSEKNKYKIKQENNNIDIKDLWIFHYSEQRYSISI